VSGPDVLTDDEAEASSGSTGVPWRSNSDDKTHGAFVFEHINDWRWTGQPVRVSILAQRPSAAAAAMSAVA